jgi:tRNA threonylcarbamoyladenosine biosynthesis protein TsaB
MITLAIDASTYTGDVAILDGAEVIAEASIAMRGAEHERLMPAVADCLERAAHDVKDIGRVVCGAGPGSFTSLRIAGAIAKGIATGVGCPLFAIPSMALILGGTALAAGRYLVAIDALRDEFYVGLYVIRDDSALSSVEPARLVRSDDIQRLADEYESRIVSPSPGLGERGAIHALPRARGVARLSDLLDANGPIDLSTWEPAYGRLAEAQVKWESTHGRALPTG